MNVFFVPICNPFFGTFSSFSSDVRYLFASNATRTFSDKLINSSKLCALNALLLFTLAFCLHWFLCCDEMHDYAGNQSSEIKESSIFRLSLPAGLKQLCEWKMEIVITWLSLLLGPFLRNLHLCRVAQCSGVQWLDSKSQPWIIWVEFTIFFGFFGFLLQSKVIHIMEISH